MAKEVVKKKVKYLTNANLYAQVKLSKEQGRMSQELAKMFMLLVNNVGKHRYYSGFTYLDDMKGEALVTLCKMWDRFNLDYDNPFAYYTQLIKNAFLAYNKKELHGRNIIASVFIAHQIQPCSRHGFH